MLGWEPAKNIQCTFHERGKRGTQKEKRGREMPSLYTGEKTVSLSLSLSLSALRHWLSLSAP
jgi:hypothetical protein